jgi:hypothetical protein
MSQKIDIPDAPDSLPQYLIDGLDRQDIASLRDAIAYSEDLIDQYEREVEASEIAEDDGLVEDVEETNSGSIVTKRQKCAADCTCNNGTGHGPYKWKVTSDGKGGRNWEYLGTA